MAYPKSWTDAEDDIPRKGWSQGLSTTQISLMLTDRTGNSVIGRCHRLKLPVRGISAGRISSIQSGAYRKKLQQMAKEREEIQQMQQIAAKMAQPIKVSSPLPLLPSTERDALKVSASAGYVTFDQLEPNMCRFVLNAPERGGEFHFCGKPKLRGKWTCQACYERAYTKPVRTKPVVNYVQREAA